jgi:hypothetical protein
MKPILVGLRNAFSTTYWTISCDGRFFTHAMLCSSVDCLIATLCGTACGLAVREIPLPCACLIVSSGIISIIIDIYLGAAAIIIIFFGSSYDVS